MTRLYFVLYLSFFSLYIVAQDDVIYKLTEIRKMVYDSTEYNPSKALSQLEIIDKECTTNSNDTLKAVYNSLRGQTLYSLQKYMECIPYCEETIRLCEQCNLRQYEYLDAIKIIGMSYHRLKDYENAELFYRRGLLRSVSANVNATNQYQAELYLNLGKLYEAKGDSLLSVESFRRSRQLQETTPFDIDELNNLEWSNSILEKITSLRETGRYQEAVDLYSIYIDGIIKKFGKGEQYIFALYSKAILLARYLNKYEEALPLYKKIIESADQMNFINKSVCGAYCNLALCFSYLDKLPELEAFVPTAISFLEKAKDKQYPVHSLYRFIGNGAYWRQYYAQAIKYYELYLLPGNAREEGKSYDEITNQLSVSYILSGNIKNAKTLLIVYLKNEEKRLKVEDQQTLANVYHNLGRAYMLEGSKTDALLYLKKSGELQVILYGEISERTQLYINECKL